MAWSRVTVPRVVKLHPLALYGHHVMTTSAQYMTFRYMTFSLYGHFITRSLSMQYIATRHMSRVILPVVQPRDISPRSI